MSCEELMTCLRRCGIPPSQWQGQLGVRGRTQVAKSLVHEELIRKAS
jgi:hypothetical protein